MSGWVYALQRGDQIKIGMTERSTPDKRLRELQTGQPDRYTLVATWETGSPLALEQRMHAVLADRHYRGEWYSITPVEAVEAYTSATGTGMGFRLVALRLRLWRQWLWQWLLRVFVAVGAVAVGLLVTWLTVLFALDIL